MREARFHSFHSTFGKMTAFYICFGMIPLVLISLIFFFWYYLDVMQSAKSNYSQIADYVERNISDLLETADETADIFTTMRQGITSICMRFWRIPGSLSPSVRFISTRCCRICCRLTRTFPPCVFTGRTAPAIWPFGYREKMHAPGNRS